MPRVLLSSPDQKAHLRLEPDPDGPVVTLHHGAEPDRPPAWYASFGARTAGRTASPSSPPPSPTRPQPLTRLATRTERSTVGWSPSR